MKKFEIINGWIVFIDNDIDIDIKAIKISYICCLSACKSGNEFFIDLVGVSGEFSAEQIRYTDSEHEQYKTDLTLLKFYLFNQ